MDKKMWIMFGVLVCTSVTKGNDERCPSINLKSLPHPFVKCPESNCHNAEDCAEDQICCDTGCSQRCMKPPRFDDRCSTPEGPVSSTDCEMECYTNNDCRSDYMCCSQYCGSKCEPKARPCDPGQFLAKCVPLCQNATCPAFPDARCRVHGCDGCNREFYDGSNRLIKDCSVS